MKQHSKQNHQHRCQIIETPTNITTISIRSATSTANHNNKPKRAHRNRHQITNTPNEINNINTGTKKCRPQSPASSPIQQHSKRNPQQATTNQQHSDHIHKHPRRITTIPNKTSKIDAESQIRQTESPTSKPNPENLKQKRKHPNAKPSTAHKKNNRNPKNNQHNPVSEIKSIPNL